MASRLRQGRRPARGRSAIPKGKLIERAGQRSRPVLTIAGSPCTFKDDRHATRWKSATARYRGSERPPQIHRCGSARSPPAERGGSVDRRRRSNGRGWPSVRRSQVRARVRRGSPVPGSMFPTTYGATAGVRRRVEAPRFDVRTSAVPGEPADDDLTRTDCRVDPFPTANGDSCGGARCELCGVLPDAQRSRHRVRASTLAKGQANPPPRRGEGVELSRRSGTVRCSIPSRQACCGRRGDAAQDEPAAGVHRPGRPGEYRLVAVRDQAPRRRATPSPTALTDRNDAVPDAGDGGEVEGLTVPRGAWQPVPILTLARGTVHDRGQSNSRSSMPPPG